MTEVSARDRIVQSALDEIEKNGIVGLRVADVASSAGISVPLIYKYFRDRDGLLAVVLSETLTSFYMADIARMRALIDATTGPVDVTKLAELMPMPSEVSRKRYRRLRVMAIAASYDIPRLAEAMAHNQRLMNDATTELVVAARQQSGCTSKVPVNAVTALFQALAFGMAIHDGLGEAVTSDKQYRLLLIELLDLLING